MKQRELSIHKEVQELSYALEREGLFDLLMSDEFLKLLSYLFGFIEIASSIFVYFNSNLMSVLIYFTMILFSAFLALGLFVGKRPKEENDGLIKNIPDKKYMLNLGYEVRKFYGDAVKSGFRENKIRLLLLDAEKIKRHGAILATIGAGKSVLMKRFS
ncbi:hypothetical protein [Helicobacter sp. 12S02232-10]|uniref:hypothetical protein n=1 Tax=Helicobacter sp. 12S02232-10 TaxID=1476197 RepID=UPI000BA6B8D6|nr:hypothetical protein [Helicobacter sp. 12S02232-10]